jgi:S1-C subfamily serine protease
MSRPISLVSGQTILTLLLLSAAGRIMGIMTPAQIKKAYGPAVVYISVTTEDGPGSYGSGFIVSPDGKIVTCQHVISGAQSASVRLLNGASFPDVSVLAEDSVRDVAVIKVQGQDLPCVVLGNSDSVEIGSHVVAIGNPKGYENTISDGLLSGSRTFNDSFREIQISAPISPGSSGGPVFDDSGRVIGIAKSVSSAKLAQNLNFCVPINDALPFIRREPGGIVRTLANGAAVGDYAQGKADGAKAANGGVVWLLAGIAGGAGCCLLQPMGTGLMIVGIGAGLLTVTVPALLPPPPPSEALIGKSADYVRGYTEAHREMGRYGNAAFAIVGCGLTMPIIYLLTRVLNVGS